MSEKSGPNKESVSLVSIGTTNCLIILPSLIRAGAETQAVDLANGLAAKRLSVHLCSFESQLDQRQRLSEAVQFHHVARVSKYDLSLVNKLAAIIDNEKIEVVQGVNHLATLLAWLAANRSRSSPAVVAAVHTTINRNLKQELYERLLYRWILRRVAAIVFVCEYQREHWIRKYPELKRISTVVHNGVAPEEFHRGEFEERARRLRAENAISDDTFVISCIAAFRPEKGHRLLIDAFSSVSGKACLVFAGDGEMRAEIEAYANATGLKDRTRFLGNIPDTRPLIVASDATVLASTAVETFSMAMLESMALGVPMIAPQIGGLPEAIINGDTGLIFPIGDTAALSKCIQSVIDNPGDAKRMGRSAEQKVVQNFTFAKMVTASEHVLTSVVGNNVQSQ